MFTCKFCSSERHSQKSLIAHEVKCKCNPNRKGVSQTVFKDSEIAKQISKTLKDKAKEKYIKNPKRCKTCDTILDFEHRKQTCCSSACKQTNKHRVGSTLTEQTKQKIRDSANSKKKSPKAQMKIALKEAIIFSKLRTNTCAKCGKISVGRTQTKYCVEHKDLYSDNNRNRFVFTFNVYHYPDLFDLNKLNEIGWRDSINNPNGYSRDHKVSVHDAILYNYDPYYIRHVMNCDLILFEENNKKKTKSSITYEELMRIADEYDAKFGGSGGA